ncbi:MAG: hypothetical protein Q8S54_08430 [Bacteroidota bacterium]|nr:hypothetical protein [Odoribacter sp.]MDP3643200.1 hypothetical protein [Bacteroidota bacterium]
MSGRTQTKSFYGLYSDRDIYVSGETLLAKIYLPDSIPSRIICLDLVNQNGIRINGVSLAIRDNEAEGYLQLPDSLSSGTYLIRCYQKYNAGKIKTIREIYISSRFDRLEKTDQLKRVAPSSVFPDKKTDMIQISELEKSYPSLSKIEAGIRIDESLLKELDGSLLVSVVQADSSYVSKCYAEQTEQTKSGMIEKKGIIISGIVTDKKNSEPASGITVFLTIPDSIPGFQYFKTQKDGRFFFLLDKYFGSIQAVIQCFGNTPLQRLNVKLDELFAEPGKIPDFRLQSISGTLKETLARNISAVTLRKVFGQNNYAISPYKEKSTEDYPYYGKATHTIDPKLFVDLPDFAEISRELLPGVKYRNYNNEPTLQVINNSTHYYFEENPLILLDGIPVRDLNVIKDMGTSDIERVDICKNERFYGDLRFPGVVAIYSTKKEYSRLPESSQLIRLKLEAIQLPCKLAEPNLTEPSVPDMRQILYWNPATKPGSMLSVQCNASSIIGQFKLSVKGRLKDGTLIFSEKQFEVK